MEKGLLRKRSAITLVEMMIAVLIITFIFAVAIAMIITSMRLFKTELSKSITTDDLTMALEWIKKDAIRSDDVDITTANEITLDLTDPEMNPLPGIKYYVKSGTTELYRQEAGDVTDGKLITDMIDTGNLPVFSKPEGSNYLLVEIWISDPDVDVPAHQDMGVMLRCRST